MAFKPETDDIRYSTAISVMKSLCIEKVNILAHDPVAIDNMKKFMGDIKNITYVYNWEKHLTNCDAIVILTNWDSYKRLSTKSFKEKIIKKVIIDSRRLFKPEDFSSSKYLTIGRRIIK